MKFEKIEAEPILSQPEIFPRISPRIIADFLSRKPESSVDEMEIAIHHALSNNL